jgi:hypothetical protein
VLRTFFDVERVERRLRAEVHPLRDSAHEVAEALRPFASWDMRLAPPLPNLEERARKAVFWLPTKCEHGVSTRGWPLSHDLLLSEDFYERIPGVRTLVPAKARILTGSKFGFAPLVHWSKTIGTTLDVNVSTPLESDLRYGSVVDGDDLRLFLQILRSEVMYLMFQIFTQVVGRNLTAEQRVRLANDLYMMIRCAALAALGRKPWAGQLAHVRDLWFSGNWPVGFDGTNRLVVLVAGRSNDPALKGGA